MIYGDNILSIQPADWALENATMSSAVISIASNGRATTEIKHTALISIPSSMLLTLIVDNYANTYAPNTYANLRIETDEEVYYDYMVPVVDIKNGVCTVEIETVATEYTSCHFSIQSDEDVRVLSWSLNVPVSELIDLTEVEAKIPRLLADYNTSKLTVQQREETIALISARLLDNIDVGSHLQITYIASSACTITIRCKDNNGTELFTPLLYDVNQGKGSLGIAHAYLKRLLGIHTFTITAQCSTGTLTFNTRSILYSIDAGYLAHREIDIDTDIQDISVRRLATESAPSFLYAVGIDRDGVVRVRRRPYTEQAVVAWENMYQYDQGLNAAIEFNGTWYRPIGQEYFTLLCEEHPWVFWIDTSNNLLAQYGPNEAEAFILATGVSKVKAVRGFKSEEFAEQDQGLIVVYLKDGLAHYRNYCIQAFGNFAWEGERDLPQLGSDITDIHVHRLNDYRIGIISSTPIGNKWLITERMYIAGATAPENLRGTVEDLFISVTALNYGYMFTAENIESTVGDMYVGCTESISPVIVGSYNILNETENIYVEFSHDIFEDLTNKQGYFTLVDDNNVSYQVLSSEQGPTKAEMKLTTSNFAAAANPMTLRYNNGTTVDNLIPALTVDKDNVRFAIPNANITFEALKEPPVGFISDNISASPSLTLTVTQVHYNPVLYSDMYALENISASSSMVAILVTNVGSDPL